MAGVMLWNVERTRSVKASSIREFSITKSMGKMNSWALNGWYNPNDCFEFGLFDTDGQARAFLEAIHAKIEGKEA